MKELFIIILFLSLSERSLSQECNCPNEGFANGLQPIRVFKFNNHKQIGLCGYIDDSTDMGSYEEFAIFECGHTKPIQEWGALPPCKVTQKKDTLIVGEMDWLFIGPNFSLVKVPFYMHKFFYNGLTLEHLTYYRKDLKKYSPNQIKNVIAKYQQLEKGNYDTTISISKMLFWAYVSGSKEAEVYLNAIEKKCGPFDGAIAEEWKDIVATYKHWKKTNEHR